MQKVGFIRKPIVLAAASTLVAVLVGCGGGGRDPILGGGGVGALPPTVTAVTPVNNSVGVPVNIKLVTVAFSEPMAPITGGASLVVTCAAPGINPTGSIALDLEKKIATFTLAPATSLAPSTLYTATVAGAQSLATGLSLANPYTWHFTTGAALDIIRPGVALTIPATTVPGPTLNVPINTAINAVFTEDMAPATITSTSVTLTGPGVTSVPGVVSYAVASMTGVFTPTALLAIDTTYTATITTAATDLAGNALAGDSTLPLVANNYAWTFTTSSNSDLTAPTLTYTSPIDQATGVGIDSTVQATFSEAMDPLTISSATVTLQPSGPPLGTVLTGVVAYDPTTFRATFTPASSLTINTKYTASVVGAKDLAGNLLIAGLIPNPWSFTTGTGLVPTGVNLGSAGTFGIMATAAITNTGNSIINGDVSLDPGTSMTGFPPGVVNGAIHINDLISAQARADLLIAYNYAKTLPPGTTISAGADLGALYTTGIPPGTYTSGSTMLVSTPLVLDAGGDVNAIWVFQIGSSLTTTGSVSLANGAQAKNVFWVPTFDATIGVGTIFYGTIVAGRDVTGVTGATINGRILAGATTDGTIALQNNIVNVPAS